LIKKDFDMENKNASDKAQELRRGVMVLIALAILSAVEYIIGTHSAPVIFMWMIALTKAGLVVWFFMHVKRAFEEEGEE
jgi:caa(3)-type oxidase subunit IV